MRYDSRFVKILFWETLENIPMLTGFLLAIRVQPLDLPLAFVILMMGVASGAILIHLTESKKYSNQPAPKETLVNFMIIMVLAIPIVFYFSADGAWWSNWVTDTILGTVTGVVLSFGESWGWNSTASVKVHSISMAIAFTILLLGIRLTAQLEPLLAVFTVGVVLNLFASTIIVLLEYWPITESSHESSTTLPEKPESQIAKNIKF